MVEGATKVALVIPVHNRRETTLQCLRSLSRIDVHGLELRTVVVDDGSCDGTWDAIRTEFPSVLLIKGDGTLHYAAGTNRGISAALAWQPDFIATVNDDVIFHDQFLQRMITTARANPRSVVGALLLLWSEPHRVFQVGHRWSTIRGGWQIPANWTAFTIPRDPFEAECIVGNCLLIPTDAVMQCGQLDEVHFPFGWGDAQYTSRLRKAGWKLLIEPRAYVWCEPNQYPSALHTLPLRVILNSLFVNKRHPQNLRRQFEARWYSAPSRGKALSAFATYLCSLLWKTLKFSTWSRTAA